MARVSFDRKKMEAVATRGEETKKVLKKRAHDIKDEAENVFRANDKHSDDSDDYLDSFYVRPEGHGYVVGNDARTAKWVEFGAHIYPHGNKNLPKKEVLGYSPLRTAVDIVSSYH